MALAPHGLVDLVMPVPKYRFKTDAPAFDIQASAEQLLYSA
jgi:hypothetical protein